MGQEAVRDGGHRRDASVVALVSAAHFVSHYYMLLLPPIFLAVQADYKVSFTELGLALGAFNLVTVIFQVPVGMLADAWSARGVFLLGLLIGAASVLGAALAPTFLGLIGAFAVMGLANTAYHPAAYGILAYRIAPARLGYAFSVHTFAGFLGGACAPVTLIVLEHQLGWRGALMCAAGLGVVVALILLAGWSLLRDRDVGPKVVSHTGPTRIWSAEVVRNVFVFSCLAAANSGVQGYTVVALASAWGVPVLAGAAAISSYLFLLTVGVLVGGWVAERFPRHDLVMAVGLGVSGLALAGVGLLRLDATALLVVCGLGGFTNGLVLPSRDLIVKAATPPGAFGRVFAIVTTGFSIGNMFAPFVFGLLMDHDAPRGVFLAVAAFTLGAILLSVVGRPSRTPPGREAPVMALD
ncbi:MFS transporter [Aquabacter sp. CN5-332]|uniref:MFS transporter n=1 Tax=Aquabacter sp. CN5-332 TaxID=3156608 RepID=UPI0032B5D5B7